MSAKEIVVGLGHQKSLWPVIHLAEERVRAVHGTAKKIVARSPGIEIEASRPKFEGEFTSIIVRFSPPAPRLKETLQEVAGQAPVRCDVVEVEGGVEFRCPSCQGPPAQPDQIRAACDVLTTRFKVPEVWRAYGKDFRLVHISPEAIFQAMIMHKASDAHLYPAAPPAFRIDGVLQGSRISEPLSSEQILALIEETAPARDWREFQEHQQCSYIYHQVGLGYARISAFTKAGVPHCTMRYLPEKVPSFEDLSLPRESLEKLAKLHFGMIVVAGMTGSGKSTTVASLVDWINQNKSLHVLCVEEPVEYVHANKRSVVSQRDVGVDIATFHEAVRGALRHDPDVIVIGEMRDPDTIRSAINAAATGHLVISTLHSSTSYEAVNRIVSFFDPVERDLVKLQLRDALKCVICQRLMPRTGGGRVPALEFLFNDTKHIGDSILTGNSINIKIGMQQGASNSFIFEKYLFNLVKKELVTAEQARAFATEVSIFDQMRLGTYVVPSLDSMMHH
jgi:twitching motility protein PilT